jgi:cytoskeletal protein RodZ
MQELPQMQSKKISRHSWLSMVIFIILVLGLATYLLIAQKKPALPHATSFMTDERREEVSIPEDAPLEASMPSEIITPALIPTDPVLPADTGTDLPEISFEEFDTLFQSLPE